MGTAHDVGVTRKGRWLQGFLIEGMGVYIPNCLTCGWRGPEFDDRVSADAEALAHQGGVLHLRERRKKLPPPPTEEMFPGV